MKTFRVRLGGFVSPALVLGIALLAGCEGDTGPMGLPGESGLTVGIGSVSVWAAATPVAVPAGSGEPVAVTVTVMLNDGLSLVDVPVTFRVSDGGGACEPGSARTDEWGRAECAYLPNDFVGVVNITAAVDIGGVTLGRMVAIDQSPSTLGPALLPPEAPSSMVGYRIPGTQNLVYTDGSNLAIYRPATGALEMLGDYGAGIPAPDGMGRILVWHAYAGEPAIIDHAGVVLENLNFPLDFPCTSAIWAGWSQGGDWAVAHGNCNNQSAFLAVMPSDGGAPWTTAYPSSWRAVSPAPDADWALLRDGSLLGALDLQTGAIEIFPFSLSTEVHYLNWENCDLDADGARLAIGQDGDVLVLSLTDGSLTTVLEGTVPLRYPRWTPDGNGILFSSDRSGTGENLYLLDVSGAAD